MGCVQVGTEESRGKNKKISDHLKWQKKNESTKHRILLLGPGDSGKSTILKQMNKIHLGTIPSYQLNGYRKYIRGKIVEYMVLLCQKAGELNIELSENPDDERSRQFMWNLQMPCDITPDIIEHIKILWGAPGIHETLNQRDKYQIADNVAYFFDQRFDDIVSDHYEPTFEDYLRIRIRTTGINEEHFDIWFGPNGRISNHIKSDNLPKHIPTESNNHPKATEYKDLEVEVAKDQEIESSTVQRGIKHTFTFIDVGGQRAERRKWLNMLTENIEAVVYVIAISEYDMYCFEDSKTLRITEALSLFEDVLSRGFMTNKTVTLFFNKYDLLEKKLSDNSKKTIDEFYNDFPKDLNPRDPEKVCDWVYSKFVAIYKKIQGVAATVPRYHKTYALDTKQIDNLMGDMQTDLVSKGLKYAGF